MKKTIYFLCVLALFLSVSDAFSQWEHVRRFKSFNQISVKGPLAKYNMGIYGGGYDGTLQEMILKDDSTIVGVGYYSLDSGGIASDAGTIWRLDVKSGNSAILFDSSKAFFKTLKNMVYLCGISVWKNLSMVVDDDSFIQYSRSWMRGYFIYDNDRFVKFIESEEMVKQTEAREITDCIFAKDGTLIAGAMFDKGLSLIVSNDTGSTWKLQGSLIPEFVGKHKLHNYFYFVYDTATGIIGILEYTYNDKLDSSDNNFARTTDMGKTWETTKWGIDQRESWSSAYFPSIKSFKNDTLFMVSYDFFRHDSTSFNIFKTVNSGSFWKSISVPYKRITTYYNDQFPVIRSVNSIYIPFNDGVIHTTNGGMSWTKYQTKAVNNINKVVMIDDKRGVAITCDQWWRTTGYYLFELGECTGGFEYFTLFNPSNITYKGNARTIGDYVRLTESKAQQTGSMWYDKQLAFNRSFDAKFGFKLSEGVNGEDDKTSPGADGVTLIISKNIPSVAGENGGGIGYNGVNSAIAIEFDSFINKDRNDPDYDHVGVFASSKTIENNHGSANCLGTARIPGELKANISKHNVTVIYEKIDKTLNVYFDSDNEFDTPLISIKDFDIEKFLGGPVGYIGITSSTGNSMQNHFISDFSLCFNDETVLGVEEPAELAATEEYAWPNPASNELKIKLPEKMVGKEVTAKVYDLCGSVFSVKADCIGGKEIQINISSIPAGFYYVALSDGLEFLTVPFIKN